MGLLEYDDCCLVFDGNQFENVKCGDGDPFDICIIRDFRWVPPILKRMLAVLDFEITESMVKTLVSLVATYRGGRIKDVFFSPLIKPVINPLLRLHILVPVSFRKVDA